MGAELQGPCLLCWVCLFEWLSSLRLSLFVPRSCLQRLAMLGQGASCHVGFGSLGVTCVQSLFMCTCVYVHVYN